MSVIMHLPTLVGWLKGLTFVAVEHGKCAQPGTARWAVWSMTVGMLVG